MKKSFYLLIVCMIGFAVQAQTKTDAEFFFNNGDYATAKSIYENLLKKKPKDALLNYCYAKCLYSLGDLSAKDYFDISNKKYPQGHRLMGDLYLSQYYFEEAASEYDRFLETEKADADLLRKRQQCTIGSEMMKHVETIDIIDSVVMDKATFLSKYRLPHEAGFIEQTSETLTSYTTERKDRKFFSSENNSQLDIFYTYLLLNDWNEPTALSKNINTDYNESYPFMMADGITLYFASDKSDGLGGYDIYMTRFSPITNEYLPAQNIGMPFNSTANDYMFAVDETNRVGLFATDRNQSPDSVAVYRFVFDKEKKMLKETDPETLRAYARLSKYNKAESIPSPKNQTEKNKTIAKNNGINFIVNAEITYKSLNDFKTEDTKNRFLALQILKSDFKLLQNKLQQKREEFSDCDASEKENLSWEILTIEKELLMMQKRLNSQTIELRKIENQYYQ